MRTRLGSCQHEALTVTRSRPSQKNEQADVEQKNWSMVRPLVGYERYESASAYEALCARYEVSRLSGNFFQPSQKVVSKERVGGKVRQTEDQAKTPSQRVLDAEQGSDEIKGRLRQQDAPRNPIALLRQMQRLQAVLWKLAAGEPTEPETAQSAVVSS